MSGKKDENEGAFNYRQGREKPEEIITTDKLMIPFEFSQWGSNEYTFEPFDMIDIAKKRLITVKVGLAGGDISHVMWQAVVASEKLLEHRYREWVKHFIIVCEILKHYNDIDLDEGFHGKNAKNSPSRQNKKEKDIAYKTYASDILREVYNRSGTITTLSTKKYIVKLKSLVCYWPILQSQPGVWVCPNRKPLETLINTLCTRVDKFFKLYQPEKIEVVVALIRGTSDNSVTSYTVMERIYEGLMRIKGLGYKIGMAYINQK